MYEHLPQELKDYPFFCGWRYEIVKGKRIKVPKSVKGHNADTRILDEFAPLDEVIKHIDKYDGGQYYYSCSRHRRKKGEHKYPYAKGWRQDKIDALMENIITQISSNEEFRKDMKSRLGKAVDTSEFEAQVEALTKQIRNKTKTLKRKSMLIDEFDWDVENADTLYEAS